ncbi:MAG TPA: L,D-transpeptidase/peptidoglycan binding protein [Solirubrobacteraceae bacterium]|nr:L,D-transpeptidase/peptidoglycan binding protein [Solirubrobacteraceae bacterium]
MSAPTIAPPPTPPAPTRHVRWPLVAGIAVGVIVLLAAAMFIYDHARRDVIAKGVSIAGVPVGGLSEKDARAKIERDLISELNRPVRIRSGSHHWTLSARRAGVTVDADNMVAQAVSASREGSIFTRTMRGLFGGSVHHEVPLVVSYSHGAIRKLTAQIRSEVNRAPRDATVTPGAGGLEKVPSVLGLTVENRKLGKRINHALIATGTDRSISVPARPVKPAVSTAQLAEKYPAYIVVNRGTFKLDFYDHLKLAKSYEVAVGMEGLETPAGLHHIEWEQVDPPWYVPKKAWAGSLAGTVVPPGPNDPLKARFMSIEGGAGIHGIDPSEYSSIGHDASHGCVRMRIPDVIALYDVSPVGTPVYII